MFRLGVALFAYILFPTGVYAHATPVEMVPASGAQVEKASEIKLRFSERLEESSSRIRVVDSANTIVSEGDAYIGETPYELAVPVQAEREGLYTVSWSVVSKDDGHFTRGSYAFAVGSTTVVRASDTTIVKVATMPETISIFVEFVGNSLLWGVLLLIVLVIPRFFGQLGESERPLRRLLLLLIGTGVVVGLCGALAQIILKSRELALLHEIALREAFHMYLSTAAGIATLVRMAALSMFGVIVMVGRKHLAGERVHVVHALLFVALLVFAFFRATISHATANQFYPWLSIVVNILHLIDKDAWFGILLVVVGMLLAGLHREVRLFVPRISLILAVNLGTIALTASYIVWLHLRSIENTLTTDWGERFLYLALAAGLLIATRLYHVLTQHFTPRVFARYFQFSISFEATLAGIVVFFSSLVIITSPPSHAPTPEPLVFKGSDYSVQLEVSPYEDNQMLLTLSEETKLPIVRLGEDEGALLVPLAKRFERGYVFPRALLNSASVVTVQAEREGAYDVQARFVVAQDTFAIPDGHGRRLDFFTRIMIALALSGLVFAAGMYRLVHAGGEVPLLNERKRAAYVKGGIVLALIVFILLAQGVIGSFGNQFKKLCLSDGNGWHMMQPLRAGAIVSDESREGCMLSSQTYHFADSREYAYMRSLPQARVALEAPERIEPQVPTALSFSLTEEDGTPAILSIEHERILHVIIVGADMQTFAHIHPDDAGIIDATRSEFTVTHVFPQAGQYVVAVDYMHGLKHESKQFTVSVGEPGAPEIATYDSPGSFASYDVEMKYIPPLIGSVATLQYTISKEGKPVTDMVPYLGAPMHLAIVKNDLSEFMHTHGEVHPPGYIAPTSLKNHVHTPPPAQFGPVVEAHVEFPSPGTYTVFGEFKRGEEVVTTRFTLRVESL